MFNLLKMDFYRLFHSKAIKVGAIAAAVIAFVGMFLNWGVLEIITLATKESGTSAEGMEIIFPIISWLFPGGVDFGDVILTGTDAFTLFVSCMITASFIGAEQSCGYVKNIAGQISNKGLTIVSKLIVTCFIQFVVLAIYVIVSVSFSGMFFGKYITSYSIAEMIGALALRFLLFCAVDAVLVFLCTLTKSHAIAMVIGAIFGMGVTRLVYIAGNMIMSMLKISVDLAKFMPDGINGILSVGSLGEVTVKAIIVSVIFIAGFLTAAILIFKKRDVR